MNMLEQAEPDSGRPAKQEIRVGQIWEDNDSRMRGRQGTVVDIDEEREKALINWGRKTWVSFKRLRRASQYRLVHDPKAVESLKPFQIDCEIDGFVGTHRNYEGPFTLLVWAADHEDAKSLLFEFLEENGKVLSDPEDCSYQIHTVKIARGVTVWSGMMVANSE
jgi:hypothetical protein